MSSTVFVNSVTLTAASWFQDVDNVAYQYLSGVAGTNTITATGPAGLGAYAAGLKFRFIPAATNTGATTINITGTAALGARSIFSGGVALTGGELTIGIPVEIVDDGTQFNILAAQQKRGVWTPTLRFGGLSVGITYGVQTGSYVKIDNLVTAFYQITLTSKGSSVGSADVAGLPFTISTAAVGTHAIQHITTSTFVSVIGTNRVGNTAFFIQGMTAAAANYTILNDTNFSNTSVLVGTAIFSV